MQGLPCDIPVIVFTKNGGLWLESIAQSGCRGVGLDWTIDIDVARKCVGNKIALQGNLDPMILYASPEVIATEATRILDLAAGRPGHIFNLGHGILPDISPDAVSALVETIKSHTLSRRH